MKYTLNTYYDELAIKVVAKANSSCKLRMVVYDADNKHRIFTNRYKQCTGEQEFFVRLPQSPRAVVIELFNMANGPRKKGEDPSFEFISASKVPLEKKLDVGDIKNDTIKSFVKFAQQFSYNAQDLEDDRTYQSDDGRFFINYLPTIVGKGGNELKTPARISKQTGVIEVSKKSFLSFTVAMRMAILLHEFSHYFLNTKIDDEMEADLNGLLIYLGLGYPRIEGQQAFLETFIGSPSEQNKQRYDVLNQFIKDFENLPSVLIQKK